MRFEASGNLCHGRVAWLVLARPNEAATTGELEGPAWPRRSCRRCSREKSRRFPRRYSESGEGLLRRVLPSPDDTASDRAGREAIMSLGPARESFAPIGSNLQGYDNYFCRDCRRIVRS